MSLLKLLLLHPLKTYEFYKELMKLLRSIEKYRNAKEKYRDYSKPLAEPYRTKLETLRTIKNKKYNKVIKLRNKLHGKPQS